MKCKFCSKEMKNIGGLTIHEKYGCSLNPNRLYRKSNFVEYNERVNNGELEKKFTNQFTKAQELGIECVVSEQTKLKISNASKKQVWTTERKQKHSESMMNAVRQHPESYSAKNVCGRTKKIQYKGFNLTGKWEYDVARYFDKHDISWTNKISPFEYKWENKIRNYFPDFYLFDFDLYIEVKGYETERDRAKWSVVPNLFVIKKNLIEIIRSGGKLRLTN
jgi:hypothetical protein